MNKFKVEYECTDQAGKIVAKGEFYLERGYSIRSNELHADCMFALGDHERNIMERYRGTNQLKRVSFIVHNVRTGSVRFFR